MPFSRLTARSLTRLLVLSGTIAAWAFPATQACAQPPDVSAAPTTTASAAAPTETADQRRYRLDIEFLANPFMEGRGPGTRGNEIAAEYVEARFRELGLKPVIPPPSPQESPTQQVMRGPLFRQPFTAGSRAELKNGEIRGNGVDYKSERLDLGSDFSVLGFSGNAEITAPLTFVGYSIDKGGPDGKYTSYPSESGDKPLDGRIAVMFRFEPMDKDGKSAWRKNEDSLWTTAAGLSDKLQAAVKRGAAGIILVSPPGCADPRSRKLDSTEGSARWTRPMDIPVIMMTAEAATRLLQSRDPQHRTAEQFRALADASGEIIPLGDEPVTLTTAIDRSPRKTWNIAGVLPGSGSLADQYIIIGAHYDHVGYGYTGGSRSDEYGVVHPGADDNASGTAGLLLLAQRLKDFYTRNPAPSRRSIMFIAFSAEEMGLIGSREFIKNAPIPATSITAMLNMDMIGRLRESGVELAGTGTARDFDQIIKPALDSSGLNFKVSPGGRGPSDHATFYGAGVPVLHFFTGLHEQYHTPRDTVDTINVPGAVQVVDVVENVALALAQRPEALAFQSTDRKKAAPQKDGDTEAPQAAAQPDKKPDSQPGALGGGVKVRFGIAPGNYAEGEQGVEVGEVYPGTAAAEAGIQPGDRLMRWNGKEIGDVANWMEFLTEHKPGDVVDVTIKRKGEESTVRVTLKSRDQVAR